MGAKIDLFERLKHLDYLVNQSTSFLVDQGIAYSPHNGGANLLRKGLGIISFNILEDFIKNRTQELLGEIPRTGVPFNKLPKSLQKAATTGALNALSFKSKREQKDNLTIWNSLLQEEALKIHSTKNPIYEISSFSLLSSNSNINSTDIGNVIRAFGINDPWGELQITSHRIGGGTPNLLQTYKNLSERRHTAAHEANFRYSYQWIQEIHNEIISLTASLDILLTARLRQINAKNTIDVETHNIHTALNFRFLELSGSTYRETKIINGRAIKIWPLLNQATNSLIPKLQTRQEFLIVLDSSKRIKDWYL